jgi:hypothetical protein
VVADPGSRVSAGGVFDAAAGAGVRGGSGDDGVRGGNGDDGAPDDGGGDHGAPVGAADGPAPRLGPDGPEAGAPEKGGLDTGRDGAGGPLTELSAGRAGADVPLADSAVAPLEPLVSARIGDGRRVRNQADSTSRKMGGSSIVWSGRGSAPSSSPGWPGWPD